MRKNKGISHFRMVFFSILALLFTSSVVAQELSEDELEQWLESDDQVSPYEEKGGGEELKFIHPPPDEFLPSSHTRLELTETSVESGWVRIEQCHTGLDPVPDAEVVYQFRQMRHLRVIVAEGIEQFWVEGQSVQLKRVGRGARLCVALEAQILLQTVTGDFRLRYGPFQRRFLDSYFPMHVSLAVDYSRSRLRYGAITPTSKKGFDVIQEGKQLSIDAWFMGKLTIVLDFYLR